MYSGWVKIHRKSKEHWLYQKKPFDDWHAWQDLLLTVNHEQNKFLHGNKLLTIERGQTVTSLRKLGERWGWSKGKVQRFLELLLSDGMVKIQWDSNRTLITVANWDFFQCDNETAGQSRDSRGTQTATNKNEKKEKNERNEKNNTEYGAPCGASPPESGKKHHKYGEYGWVKLTDAEYSRLVSEHGESVVVHYISVVDERAQQTGNKNHWKDWNLTVRRAIRDQWGNRAAREVSQSGSIFRDIARERGITP